MVEKIDITDERERSKEVAEIISNKTCRKIIGYLEKKETSETEIAQALNLPISTVHYNIQKLLKNGFIKVKDFYWSPKGNKVNVYTASNKVFVFTPKKTEFFENKLRVILPLIPVMLLLSAFIIAIVFFSTDIGQDLKDKILPFGPAEVSLEKFSSCNTIANAFKEASEKSSRYGLLEGVATTTGAKTMAPEAGAAETAEYSETNIQVEGVDEADIVKTDGRYIYTLSRGKLIIAKAYPSDDARIVSETDLGEFEPSEIFIDKNALLIFGSTHEGIPEPVFKNGEGVEKVVPPPYYDIRLTTVELWDIKDRASPELVRTVDFEGYYLTSRKINERVYFVINSYPRYYIMEESNSSQDIIPSYRDSVVSEELAPICRCVDVEYFEPINPQNFVTVVSMSMKDEYAEINKRVIVGSGQNVYASLENLYVAEMNYPFWIREPSKEKTIIHKFSLNEENVEYIGYMEAFGTVLNQFSMDEYGGYFRIATTTGKWTRDSTNNVYIFGEDLNMTGKLEDLAPGESIYSARFMGEKGYLVTFKKIDPLFVIDLADPSNPRVLGKLKIPGYSDYLHPYDENHIIGIGKETVEAEEGDFAWYQGVKMAIFDVSDVSNPIELHRVIIGDRGTDSEILRDHKAFLFDKERELLVIPILLAEIKGDKESLPPHTHGEFVFQGAYVYRLTLENGFELKGRITHYDDNETFVKSGYYFRGDSNVQRSLYIDDILYTISQKKIKLNSLDTLEEIKELVFS